MDVNIILEMWRADSVINKMKLGDEAVRRPQLHSKYMDFLTACKREMNRVSRDLHLLKMDKLRWMQGKMTKEEIEQKKWPYSAFGNNSKPLKSDMDDYIKIDPAVSALQIQWDELKLTHDALIEIVNSVNWRNKDIQSAIDWARFEAGN